MRSLLFLVAVSCLLALSYGAPAKVSKREVGPYGDQLPAEGNTVVQVPLDDDDSAEEDDDDDDDILEDDSSSSEEWEDEDEELDRWLNPVEDLKEYKEVLEEEEEEIEEEIEEINQEILAEEADEEEAEENAEMFSENVAQGESIPWQDAVQDVGEQNMLDQFENLLDEGKQKKRRRL